jgi:hypothetical protein
MFRFTIRDVLWLIVVVGMGVGWWIDRGIQRARADSLASDNAALVAEAKLQAGRAEEAWRILTETVNASAKPN